MLGDIPEGLDPTATFPAGVWGGGNEPGAKEGTFPNIFARKIDENARRWGVKPSVANQMFWEGHPLDLPIDYDLLMQLEFMFRDRQP